MAEQQERENQHHHHQQQQQEQAEITSEETSIDEDDLELCLGFRPINSLPRPKPTFQKLPEPSDIPNLNDAAPICLNHLSKRDAQALRRQEAKKKRDLKRRARERVSEAETEAESEAEVERCRNNKASKLQASYWAPPSWWSWNPPPAGGGGFRPYQGQNGKIEGENRQSISSGNSSGVSDNYQSTSGPAGWNSSDAGSHSSRPVSQLPSSKVPTVSSPQIQPCSLQAEDQPNSSNPNNFQPQLCSSSSNNQIESTTTSTRQPSKSPDGATSSNGSKPLPEASPSSEKGSTSPPQSQSRKESKGEMGKPPKPNGQTNQQKFVLSEMPCVSTTGNGPNGKTITGFLYRYTKAEVSIVCVCHGAAFSPAGFVEHAGGVDIEHPLRHIRVVPFPFS